MHTIPPFTIGIATRRPRPGATSYPALASLESAHRRIGAQSADDRAMGRARALLALVESGHDRATDALMEEVLAILRTLDWEDEARQEEVLRTALQRVGVVAGAEATLVSIDWPHATLASFGHQRAVLVREHAWSLLSSDRDPRPVGRRTLLHEGDWIALLARGTAEALPVGSSAAAALRLHDPFKVCEELVGLAAARNPLDHHGAAVLVAGAC